MRGLNVGVQTCVLEKRVVRGFADAGKEIGNSEALIWIWGSSCANCVVT